MRLITRTVYGSALQTSRHLGIEHPIVTNSSLNEALANFTVGGNNAIVTAQNPVVDAYIPANETGLTGSFNTHQLPPFRLSSNKALTGMAK